METGDKISAIGNYVWHSDSVFHEQTKKEIIGELRTMGFAQSVLLDQLEQNPQERLRATKILLEMDQRLTEICKQNNLDIEALLKEEI